MTKNEARTAVSADAGRIGTHLSLPQSQPTFPPACALREVPAELRALKQWVCWRIKFRSGKPTKVLCQVNGRRASVTDPATWATFAEVVRALRSGRFAGIGFVFTADDPYTGVDLDHAVRDGVIQLWAIKIIRQLDSYTEYSPSGTGVHIICRGHLSAPGRKRGTVEMYDCKRFFTVTGAHVPGTPLSIEQRDEAIAEVHAEHVARAESPPIAMTADHAAVSDVDDAELLRRMFSARNGRTVAALWHGDTGRYASHSEADLALCSSLVFWCGRDPYRVDRLFRQSGLMRPKWDERRGDRTIGAMTIDCAIRSTRNFYSPGRRPVS